MRELKITTDTVFLKKDLQIGSAKFKAGAAFKFIREQGNWVFVSSPMTGLTYQIPKHLLEYELEEEVADE